MRGLARTYSDMLDSSNPGITERYRSYPKAVKNVLRIINDPNINAFLLFAEVDEPDPAIGVATVIFDRALHIQPENGESSRTGIFTDIDYWVGKDETGSDLIHPDAHREIGEILVAHATIKRPYDQILVSTRAGEQFPAGLDRRNDFQGFNANPVRISSVDGDPYGVTRQGALLNIRLHNTMGIES